MNTDEKPAQFIDYRQEHASDWVVPRPAVLVSSGWHGIHFELHQQPTFATAEHQHTMHVLACGLVSASGINAPGLRWLDGKATHERRSIGDIAVIPAGIAHRCSWDTPAQFMVLAIEPALLQQIGQDWVNPDRIELLPRLMDEQDSLIYSLFLTFKEEVEQGGMGSHLLVDSLKAALAVHLLRNYCATQPKRAGYSNGLSAAQLRLVTDYINEHLHQDLKLDEIAAIVQISPYHFLRLFKQRLGITPHQYILQRRVNQAKNLLQHGQLTLADIAIQTGFCDQSHLTRCFKRMVGVTPKQLLRSQSADGDALPTQ